MNCRRPLLIAATILLLCVLALPAGNLAFSSERGSGTRAVLDVGIEDIEILKPATGANSHYPGQACTINVTVTNFDDVPLTAPFDVAFAVNDGFSNSTISNIRVNTVLSAYGSGLYYTILQFQFTPPLYAPPEYAYPHNFQVVATVVMPGDQVQSNNQRTTTLAVLKADFKPRLDFGAYVKDTGKTDPTLYDPVSAAVGQNVLVPITLYNDGKGQDSIKIVCVEKPLNWSVYEFKPIDLDDGANTTEDLNLIVKVADQKQDALEGVDYVVKLKAYSMNYAPAEHEVEIHFAICFCAGLELIAPALEYWEEPGKQFVIDVELYNRGNGKDSFFSSLEPLRDISTKQGWKAYIDSGSLTPAISRGEHATVKVRVCIPPNVMKGAHAKITLNSCSNKAAGSKYPVETSVSIEVYASRLYNPVLEPCRPVYEVMPGAESLAHFNLTNAGNGRDPTIDLRITNRPEGWVVGLDESEIPANGLGFMCTAEIGLKMIVPASAPAREGYFVRIEAWAGEPLEKEDTMDLCITVLEKSGVEAFSALSVKNGYVGGVVEFPVTVKNTGNAPDIFLLDARMKVERTGKDWVLDLSQDMVNLTSNMSRSLTVKAFVPLDAPADPEPSTSNVLEGYGIDLAVMSTNDPANTTRHLTLTVKVQPMYGFSMEADRKSVRVSADRKETVPFNLVVNNTGNVKDIVDFEVEADQKWCSLLTIHKYIPHRESRTAVVQVEAPLGTAPGTYSFTVVGRSRSDPSYSQSLTLEVEVVSYNFRVRNVCVYNESLDELISSKAYDPATGYRISDRDTVLVRAEVVNTGDRPYVSGPYGDVTVSFYYGHVPINSQRVNLTYMEPGKPYSVTLLWNSSLRELQELRIVVDSQDNIPESDESDNTARVLVNVTSSIQHRPPGPVNPIVDALLLWVIPGGVALLIIMFVFLTLYILSNTRIEYVDTGYTEDGVYDPASEQYDAFANDEAEVIEEEEMEIDFGDGGGYSLYSPAGSAQAPPYALPPASPYSTAALEIETRPPLALPPFEPQEDEGFLMASEVEDLLQELVSLEPVETRPVTTRPVATTRPVTTTRPPSRSLFTRPVTSTRPVTTRPVMTTRPVAG